MVFKLTTGCYFNLCCQNAGNVLLLICSNGFPNNNYHCWNSGLFLFLFGRWTNQFTTLETNIPYDSQDWFLSLKNPRTPWKFPGDSWGGQPGPHYWNWSPGSPPEQVRGGSAISCYYLSWIFQVSPSSAPGGTQFGNNDMCHLKKASQNRTLIVSAAKNW